MWTIYKLWKTKEHTILKLWTLIKNIIESTHKFPYNILLTFLMDRGRAPNGIGHLMILARPKGGLYRYHVKRIHFTMQGFGFLSAILRQNWWPCTTTTEVPPLFNLARFDLNKDCCWKNYLQTDSDYFSRSICSLINCISIEITIQLNS